MNGPSTAPATHNTGYAGWPSMRSPDPLASADRRERTEGAANNERRLLIREQVLSLLQLPNERVQQLINTRQLTPFLIGGVERFDSSDVYHLIDTYMSTAARRPQ